MLLVALHYTKPGSFVNLDGNQRSLPGVNTNLTLRPVDKAKNFDSLRVITTL
jgi:hypothetical protein